MVTSSAWLRLPLWSERGERVHGQPQVRPPQERALRLPPLPPIQSERHAASAARVPERPASARCSAVTGRRPCRASRDYRGRRPSRGGLMTETIDNVLALDGVRKPGIWTEQVQRAAGTANAARRVKAEPGNLFSLANYRRAREAAAFLNQTFNIIRWVRCVHPGYAADHAPVIL